MQQQETKQTRRIRQVSVTNLFGIFNHIIPLKMDEHITIIHGPNGFGKTVILKLLRALFGQSTHLLEKIPFDEFRVDFEDDSSFWVSKTLPSHDLTEEEHPEKREIVFHATGRKPYTLPPQTLPTENFFPLSQIDRIITTLDRIGPDAWLNMHTGETLSFEDVVERFGDCLPTELLIDTRTKLPEWLVDIRKSVPIRFIETQRLLSARRIPRQSQYDKAVRSEYTVKEDSRHLVEVIRRKLAESATLSQSLDRTFPARVISPTTQQLQVTQDELLDKLQALEKMRLRLMTVGLLDQEKETEIPLQGIEATTKAVLAVYAEDTERKLGFFDDLAQKIDLLITFINDRFLYKIMTIDKEKGLVLTTKNGTSLPLENLSSGEQHELVLFYDLLFRVSPSSLILIDEPELSLHVVWQRQFLKDIQQVTKLTNIDVIIATHSPSLISDRRELMVGLKGPEDGRS